MKTLLNRALAAIFFTLLWPGLAQAVPVFYGIAGSTNGTGYIFKPEGPAPVNASNSGCGNNYCVATTVRASRDGLGAYYYQGGAGNYVAAGKGSAGVGARGDFEIIALQPGAPATLAVSLDVVLSGATKGEVVGEALASGGFSVGAGVNGWGDAFYKENFDFVLLSSTITSVKMENLGAGVYRAHLQVPVGTPFDLRLTLEAFGTASGAGGRSSVEAAYEHTLVLKRTGPVFQLPQGYTAQSDDWDVKDNQWCGQTCGTLSVPEPSTLALLVVGFAALGMRRLRSAQECGRHQDPVGE